MSMNINRIFTVLLVHTLGYCLVQSPLWVTPPHKQDQLVQWVLR